MNEGRKQVFGGPAGCGLGRKREREREMRRSRSIEKRAAGRAGLMSAGQERGQGPAGPHLPQEGEEPRVRGQIGVDGEGQERGTHQMHWPLGGENQHHDVLSWREFRQGARGAGTQRPQEQQQPQRQPGLPAQQHLGLTWRPHPPGVRSDRRDRRTSSCPATASFSPFRRPLTPHPSHCSLSTRPASPLAPTSLRDFPSAVVTST